MVQLNILVLTALGLAVPAVAQTNFCTALSHTPYATSATGFRFSDTGSGTWHWWSRDKGTDLKIYQDCKVVQNRYGSRRPLRTFCLDISDNYQCWEAPGQNDPQGECTLLKCNQIVNAWGWFD
ncbi:hypothetical protein P3342_004322 [Pyrenophora teres f. teres]|uniref:Uncharacterized protein n=2 Tax=Pyrenophora teres f. teres TaxID=97479 RepID=E3S704_PYRTT|nr:hypothetical protein PTT_18568 [Pyrenophora teres f. teres 0-1]KAE8843356.1 hypothetical protein HRS9139_02653 [Pyrenophora teres f. teres]KAE8849588.1 hypothetical protein PTNB85_00004 [Pyrenophora teres f. teres]KAE8852384.1 hypothetical protein HRS9122_02671 [Pyrenophora teres f. teres]KAE8871057.1 hypothetical protein PTNB29_01401 [Pyrenophora teres f. teres]